MKPIAIVIPWFGRELKGGAEQLAWQLSTRLAARGHKIEVLTTCCRSFLEDWGTNHLKSGKSFERGVLIRRFKVKKRHKGKFNTLNEHMLATDLNQLKPGANPFSPELSVTFVQENINSRNLLKYLKSHVNKYEFFIFLPYLYGPTLIGLPLVAEKAFLLPCLHNEVYAYLPEVAGIFQRAKKILYNSEGEAHLAASLYGPGMILKSAVMGVGIEADQMDIGQSTDQCRPSRVSEARFVLYLGRRDPTKNVDLLVRAYAQFKDHYPSSTLKLVLAGPGGGLYDRPISGVIDLGLVPEAEKKTLLVNCLALFQPSRNESFSRVVMESWFHGRPVVAHRDCLATAMVVNSAKGGWLAETEQEWAHMLSFIDNMEREALEDAGSRGRVYAEKHAVWDKVIDRYEQVLGLSRQQKQKRKRPRKLKAIHQMTPGFTYGDAISNQAVFIRNHLRNLGYESNIYVQFINPNLKRSAKIFELKSIPKNAGLIYHHSIGSDLTPYAIAHPGPKYLMYHNITPAELVKPFDPVLARRLERGRSDLQELSLHFPLTVGDSYFNSQELEAFGFQNPAVLPICVDPGKWNREHDLELMENLQDGRSNLLFVGRLSPNKCQHELIEAFYHYLTMDANARLILVGEYSPSDPYYAHMGDTIEKLGIGKQIILPGKASDSKLQSYYRTAHLFWSMSEHEGFGVPMVEAMWFDVPVLAYKKAAVPETLGKAGIIFTTKNDFVSVAAAAKLLVKDEALRNKVLTAQRVRRMDFIPEKIYPKLDRMVEKMEKVIEKKQ